MVREMLVVTFMAYNPQFLDMFHEEPGDEMTA